MKALPLRNCHLLERERDRERMRDREEREKEERETRERKGESEREKTETLLDPHLKENTSVRHPVLFTGCLSCGYSTRKELYQTYIGVLESEMISKPYSWHHISYP